MATIAEQMCECGNCDWEGTANELGCPLDETPDLHERLDPGSVVPAGECPECRCFAYFLNRYHVTLRKTVDIVVEASSRKRAREQAVSELEDFDPKCEWIAIEVNEEE